MIPISRANNTVYFFNERNEPKDIASEIWTQTFSVQSRQGVSACFLTCKCWKKIVAEDSFLTFKKDGDYFGKAKWNAYFGDIGIEPLLPNNIQQILNALCPFWLTKKVKETHLLVLVPRKVNGRSFHLDALEKLIKTPKAGHKQKKYDYYDDDVKKEWGSKYQSSHWALVTKNVIPKSRNKTYAEQQKLLKHHYVVPKALEIATAILTHYVESKERLYTDNPNTYTRCEEKVCQGEYRVVVGSFGSSGLRVHYGRDDHRHAYRGLSGARRF